MIYTAAWPIAFAGLVHLVEAEFALAGQLFQLEGSSSVDNAKLSWASVNGASSYQIEQSLGSAAFQTSGTVNTLDSYGLTPSSLRLKSELEADGVYYRYNYETAANGSFSRFIEQTSSNGYDFSGEKVVLTGETLCAPANYLCKLDRMTFRKHPRHTTSGPITEHGAQSFTFDGAYRPNAQDSRDIAFFPDGNDAYLVTSTNTNTDNNIYGLTSNWTAIDSLLVTVNPGGHRKAPAVLKSNGWYYIFTSHASGWLPSEPQYISAQTMAGPWSSTTTIGSTSTFGAQSDGVSKIGNNATFAQTAYRWSNQWPTKGGPTRRLLLPLSLSPQGSFASSHYYPRVQYSDTATTPGQSVYGVQSGRILSLARSSSSSSTGTKDLALANKGVQTDPNAAFIPSSVPFWYQVDLQAAYKISQVDLTTKMVQGSETYYKYTVSGSNSTTGDSFMVLADQREKVDVGFSSATVDVGEAVRYVRINVDAVVNNVNGNGADRAVALHEVTVRVRQLMPAN